MPTEDLTPSEFYDIFGKEGDLTLQETPTKENQFSFSETNHEVFIDDKKETQEEVVKDPPEDEERKTPEDEIPDTELFVHEEDLKKQGRKRKYNFEDATGYFEDRIKAGKFVPVEIENDKGEAIPFLPKSPEDYDEFIDFQVNHRFQEKEKEVEENWYKSKSPAWQTVAGFAEKVSHPSELIPFIQGVQNIDNLAEVDETTIDGAKTIYRNWLSSRGEPQDTIEEQIALAEQSEKLLDLAGKYKPVMIQRESERLSKLSQQKEKQQQEYFQIISENQKAAVQAIEAPIFGKQKLKDDEKALIYDMIAVPNPEIGGYGIYAALDKLFETKDFNTLRELALHIGKKESFLNYYGNVKKDEVAQGLQRKLVAANSTKQSSSNEEEPSASRLRATNYQAPKDVSQGFRR